MFALKFDVSNNYIYAADILIDLRVSKKIYIYLMWPLMVLSVANVVQKIRE